MSHDPAFLFYSSDFLTGTMIMTNEQVGKYIRLLCLQHQKGYLREKDILNICNGDYDEIIEKFIKDENGNYYNKRLKEEADKRNVYTESRRKNLSQTTHKGEHMETHKGEHMENENEDVNSTTVEGCGGKDFLPKEIVEYFNLVCGTKYKYTSQKTKDLITARVNEKFTLEDFVSVIDKKYTEWKDDVKMQKFIRPETLFSNKFEGYLNQITDDKKSQDRSPNKISQGVFKL